MQEIVKKKRETEREKINPYASSLILQNYFNYNETWKIDNVQTDTLFYFMISCVLKKFTVQFNIAVCHYVDSMFFDLILELL